MSDEQHTLEIDENGEIIEPDATVELPPDPPPGTEVAVAEPAAPVFSQPLDPQHMSLDEIGKVGRVFAASGMFSDTRDAAQCVVKILAGQELGIGPFAAMANIDIIKGQPEINANLMRALVQRSDKYGYRIMEWDDKHCVMEWTEDGEVVGESSFTLEEAKRAGLSGANWQKFAKAMLLARATSQGARAYAPGIFGGNAYVKGEISGE